MADRIELARQYMDLQRDNKIDEAIAMLAEDVSLTNPMTGTVTGKSAVETAIRSQPRADGMNIEWSEPELNGDTVSTVGTGLPFGPIKVALSFNGEDKINKIDIGLGA